jgi:hemin uptake protein HemP
LSKPSLTPNNAQAGSTPRKLDLRELLGPAREIILTHQGEEYRLRITSNRKLILTK